MSTTLSYSTFGAAMAGNDTVGAHARRHTHHQVIMKMLVSGAIALGVWVGVAAPASADPNPSMGNGITNAQQNSTQAPSHRQAPRTYNGYLLPQGYHGKP